jgi:hypothetical protein
MKAINGVADCLAGVGAYSFGIIATSAMVTAPIRPFDEILV